MRTRLWARAGVVVAAAGAGSLLAACSSGDASSSDTRRVMGYTAQRQPIYADAATQAALDRRDKALKVAKDVQTGKKRLDQLKPEERALLATLATRDAGE